MKYIFIIIILFIACGRLYSQWPPTFTCATVPYVSITGSPGPTGDDATLTVPIGFTFNYFGTQYTRISICTNGFAILDSSTFNAFTNNLCQTSPANAFPMLAPFWDDLLVSSGQIVYTTLGNAPNRIFIVQWTNVPYFSGTGTVTMQLRLWECARIEFLYGPSTANTGATGHIGVNRSPGGSGNILNIVPASACNFTTSTTSCTNVAWFTPVGTLYRSGLCESGINNKTGTIPDRYSLSQNYPNPFNPTTKISYDLPKSGNVELKIYDVLGREVKTLVNEFKPAGSYDVTFDANEFASGLYFYTINVGEFTETKKMLLIK